MAESKRTRKMGERSVVSKREEQNGDGIVWNYSRNLVN